jgi:uncharacterized SAM-binding protein YcdF (DUF218 family)
MFFAVSKILGFFALPANALVVLGVLGTLLLATRWKRVGIRLAAVGLLLIAVCGLSPLGNALMLPLEDRFPPWDPSRGAPDGIVVLGGAFENGVSGARGVVTLNDAAERMTSAVELARRFPAARILFSGGSGQLMASGPSEAALAQRLFTDLGIDPGRLILEDRSRDTAENAVFSKALAEPKSGEHWLLVTSASHMPRAVGAFRRAGFPVDAYPVDWRTRGPIDLILPFVNVSDGLKRTDTAMREWVGLAIYRLTDRSSELFPGPES